MKARTPATHSMSAKKWVIWAASWRQAGGGRGDGKTLGPSRASRARASAARNPPDLSAVVPGASLTLGSRADGR